MITKEKLLELDKKGIEELFNSYLTDFNVTSIDPSIIKIGMLTHLKKEFSGIECNCIDYHYNSFYLLIDNIRITGKISVKSTNKIIQVTKLKSKYIKGKGSFKIDEITHGIRHLCYEFSNEKTWKIKIEKGYTSSGDPSTVFLTDFNKPLKDMLSVEFLLNAIQLQYDTKKYDQYRKEPYTGFINNLKIDIAQPVIKQIFFKIRLGTSILKKSQLKIFPEPYYSKLPNQVSTEDLFGLIVETVAEINSELITDVVNNKTFIY